MPVYIDTTGNTVLSVAVCDRCNRKFAYVDLMPDPNFPGMRVCKDDLDQYDPWRLPARQTENIALRFPRPDVSVALVPNEILTQSGFYNGNSVLIEGVPPASVSQGNLDTASNVVPTTTNLNPYIYNCTPNTGPKAGGTNVVVTGANFTNVTNLKFGGVNAASFIIVNSTEITAVTPAYVTTGLVDIVVLSAFGTGTNHGGFTYT
jgi:hypothetical protein